MLASVREVALAQDIPDALVRAAHDVFGVDYATYDEISLTDALVVADPAPPPGIPEAWSEYAHEHPGFVYQQRTGTLPTLRLSDLATEQQLRRLGLWWHVFRPLGIRHQIAITVQAGPDHLIGLGLSRKGRDFSDDELAAAELLAAELQRVVAARGLPSRRSLERLGLTRREAEVLLLARTLPSTGIGERLGISTRTVEKHLQHVYEKLGVSNRTEALATVEGGSLQTH